MASHEDFWGIFDVVADEIEQFFLEMGETVERVAEEIHATITTEIDYFLETVLDPVVESYIEYDYSNGDDHFSMTYKVRATPDKNPACMGCQHYHGESHGGNLLVCGMHPYGWDGESCPDWEQGKSHTSFYDDYWL